MFQNVAITIERFDSDGRETHDSEPCLGSPLSSGVLATSCEDGGINFWDLRRPSSPFSVIEGAHSHWAMSVKYCPDNEKVVATGGGDGCLHMWDRSRAASDASGDADAHNHAHADADGGASGGERQGKREEDEGPVLSSSGVEGRRFESIFSIAWGRNWRLAGLSYDGRFVVGQVPASVRYGITNQ